MPLTAAAPIAAAAHSSLCEPTSPPFLPLTTTLCAADTILENQYVLRLREGGKRSEVQQGAVAAVSVSV